jgi:tetratricopeptide (TPR) repeat protein
VAASRYANAAAGQLYTRALALVEKFPVEQQASLRATLHYKRGIAHVAAAQYEDAVNDFHRALKEARGIGDSLLECRVLIAVCEPHFQAHQMTAFRQRAQEALDAALYIHNEELHSEALAQLARNHQATGELEASRKLYDQSIMIARQRVSEGSLDAVDLQRDLAFLPDRVRRRGIGADGRRPAGIGIAGRGEPAAIPLLEGSRKYQVHEAEANALINLVQDYTLLGEHEKAAALIGEVDAAHKRDAWHAWRYFDIRFQAVMAEYCIAKAELERAASHAWLLLANATRQRTPKYIVVAHKTLCEIALANGDTAAAAREIDDAFRWLESHPAPLVAWRCHALAGRLRLRMGDREAARQAFAEGTSIVESIAATITDERVRSIFLAADAVREVISGTAGAKVLAG